MKKLYFTLLIFQVLNLHPITVRCQDVIDTSKLYPEYMLDYYPSFILWSINSEKFNKVHSTGELSTVVNTIVRNCTAGKYGARIFDGVSNHMSGLEPKEMRANPWIEIIITKEGKAILRRARRLEEDVIITECLKLSFQDALFNPGLINGTPVKSAMMYILKSE